MSSIPGCANVMRLERADEPIFIVGCSRSGTHLLRNILNRHPEIGIFRETHFFTRIWQNRPHDAPMEDAAVKRTLESLARARSSEVGFPRDAFSAAFAQTNGTPRAFYDTLLRTFATSQGKRRFGDKTPHHFLYAAELFAWYPKARMVMMVRDPRAAHASFKMHPRFGTMGWADRSAVGRSLYWNLALSTFDHWHPGGRILKCRYEDLVQHPEREVAAICGFLGVSYDDDLLAVTDSNSSFGRRSQAGIFRDSLMGGRLLGTGERTCIEVICGGRMLQEGYALSSVSPRLVRGLRSAGVYRMLDRAHKATRRALVTLVPARRAQIETGR